MRLSVQPRKRRKIVERYREYENANDRRDERAERRDGGAHFPRSGRGQKRFRRSTKQRERLRAVRKTTSSRSVRCVMRENLRARQPRGTCVLKEISTTTVVLCTRENEMYRSILSKNARARIVRKIARYLKCQSKNQP